KPVDGFTPEQRFFISYGQGWCENYTDQVLRLLAQTNPHAPTKYRVNGVVVNLPEFQKAFNCKGGQLMVPAKRCAVWEMSETIPGGKSFEPRRRHTPIRMLSMKPARFADVGIVRNPEDVHGSIAHSPVLVAHQAVAGHWLIFDQKIG